MVDSPRSFEFPKTVQKLRRKKKKEKKKKIKKRKKEVEVQNTEYVFASTLESAAYQGYIES
jgi:hypothetical protein